AVPSYVCASSATPMAAVLIAKGLSPGAALAGLLLGPATNLATVAWLRRSFGARAAWFGISGLVGVTWSAALLVNQFVAVRPLEVRLGHEQHGFVAYLAVTVLGLFVLRSLWYDGLAGWLKPLSGALAASHGESEMDHPGSHGHAIV